MGDLTRDLVSLHAESINNYIIIKICKKMKKRNYEIPAMKVVELRHKGMLMTSGLTSTKGASMNVVYEEEDF